jgi:fucose permease
LCVSDGLKSVNFHPFFYKIIQFQCDQRAACDLKAYAMATRSDNPDSPVNLSTSVPHTRRDAQITTWACYLALFASGAGTTLIGPSLAGLSLRFGWPLENMGIFPALQSAGIMIGVLVGGALLDRFGARGAMVTGAVLVCAGMWLFSVAPLIGVAFAAILTVGLGFGLLTVGPNVIIQLLNPAREGAALNRLNIFYGLGAIIGPQVAGFALAHGGYPLGYMIAGALTLLISLLMVKVTVRPPAKAAHGSSTQISRQEWLFILPFAAILFIYVGCEVGYTSWISTQMQLVALSSATVGALATSIFWCGLTVGRGGASLILHRLSNQQLLLATSLIVVIGTVLLLVGAHNELLALICTFIIGVGFGPVFPTTFALAGSLYPAARGALSGVLIAIGSVGAVILPPLQGQIGGGHDGGMLLTLFGALALFGLFSLVFRQTMVRSRVVAAVS